jgi:nitrite reductase (NADH) small subunit
MMDWVEVCPYDSIYPDTGVCALVDGRQVAVYRLSDGSLHALSNFDPFSSANVMSRGIIGDRGGEPKVASPIYKQTFNLRIIGDRGGEPKVASPIYKQTFNLRTGACYEDSTVRLDVFRVRRRSGVVEVSAAPVDATEPELDDETLDGLGYTRA